VESRPIIRANPDGSRAVKSYGRLMRTAAEQHLITPPPLFGTVLCVTDGSERGAEAVRQAARLAGRDGALELVALAPDPAPGQPRPQAAQIESLVAGSTIAAQVGVRAAVHIDATSDPVDAVLRRCQGHALAVLPAGPLARAVLPRAEIPVLVARPGAYASDFPGTVLIAVDGTPEAHAAVRLGARLAGREQTVPALVASPEHDAPHQHALQWDAATVERVTGQRPLILDEHGPPAASILAAASSIEASLILIGSRPGRPAASVSAKVAERAPCSVLVLRPDRRVSRPDSAV
jgi:nucleotide-binding universal stress UspA family protein